MPHFKDKAGGLHFLEKVSDAEKFLPAGCTEISDPEADAIRAVPTAPTAEKLLAALVAQYENRMHVIAADYPPSERESWPVQTSEARALLADSAAVTPWIDAAAAARGLDRVELATRIAAKDAAYRAISGTLTGVRQRIEDEISAAGAVPEALAAIDVTAGWPA